MAVAQQHFFASLSNAGIVSLSAIILTLGTVLSDTLSWNPFRKLSKAKKSRTGHANRTKE